MKMIGSRLASMTFFFVPMAFCAWGARWQPDFSASSYSSLRLNVSLSEVGGWPSSFEIPKLPNKQSHAPNHLSNEQTHFFAGNCWLFS
jgi:hypothetical protein